jgi:hypothetical protein
MSCLYVFVDESGNLDFTSKGTKYFVLAAVTAREPLVSSQVLQSRKYELLAKGNGGEDYQCFHASEDSQAIRDFVFEDIASLNNIKINFIYAEKNKAHPDFKNATFYTLLGSALIKYLLKVHEDSPYEKVIIIFDQALTRKERDQFMKSAKPALKKIGTPYALYFHRTMTDFNGQIADYSAWAKYVSLERNEKRPLSSIANIPQTSIDIFETVNTFSV